MKRIIREGVFESNSSSSHSLIIRKRKEIKLNYFPRNSEYIIHLEEYGVTDGDELKVDIARLRSETDKARFILNVIASYIDKDSDEDEPNYPEVAYWIDYERDIENHNRNFETLISQKPFVWFKEMLEEETGTKFEYEKPDSGYFPYYDLVYNTEYSLEEIIDIDWNDEEEFKEYMRNVVFNENIEIIDADIPYSVDMSEEDL